MNFTTSVYRQIMESPLGSSTPEQGGVLFSSDGGVTVDRFIYDKKGSRSSTTYSPNVKFINDQINLTFYGPKKILYDLGNKGFKNLDKYLYFNKL